MGSTGCPLWDSPSNGLNTVPGAHVQHIWNRRFIPPRILLLHQSGQGEDAQNCAHETPSPYKA